MSRDGRLLQGCYAGIGSRIKSGILMFRCLHYSIVFSLLAMTLYSHSGYAGYYVYQLPDGSRVITDRPKYDSHYKLIKKSQKVVGMGKSVTSRVAIEPSADANRFDDLINIVSRKHNMDPALIKAVIHTESYFNPNATSQVGASGLMQLMPRTAELYGVFDLYSPMKNLDAGVRHLRYLLRRYKNRLSIALAAYNAGEKAVTYYNGIPPYRETRRYIKKVLQYQSYYKNQYQL